MQIQIQARDYPLTETLVDYVERSIRFVLSNRYEQIRRIAVRLSDVQASHGRVDKRCEVQISLPRLQDIVIEESKRDVYAAVESAIQRAGRTVRQQLKRQFFNKRKLLIPYKAGPLNLPGSR